MTTRCFAGIALAGVGLAALLQPASAPAQPQHRGATQRVWEDSWTFVGDVTTDHPTRTFKNKFYDYMMGHPVEGLQRVGRGMGETRPGYRVEVTPASQEFYLACMEKLGRDGELGPGESWAVQLMIATRRWPEAPTITEADTAAQEWADRNAGWRTAVTAEIVSQMQAVGGKLPYDLEPPPNLEKFRQKYYSMHPDERTTVMNGMMLMFKAQGWDMRSDKRRRMDEEAERRKAEREKEWKELEDLERREAQEAPEKTQEEKDREMFDEMHAQHDAVMALRRLKESLEQSKEPGFMPGDITGGDTGEADPDAARERLLEMIRRSKEGPEYQVASQPPPAPGGEGEGESVGQSLFDLIGDLAETVEDLGERKSKDRKGSRGGDDEEDDDLFGDLGGGSGQVYVPPPDDSRKRSSGRSSRSKKKSSGKQSGGSRKGKSSGSCSRKGK